MSRTQFGLNLYGRWYDSVPKAILSLLEPMPDAKVVDLGCGDGSFTLEVQKRIGCSEVIGIEIHKPSIEKARQRGIKVIEWDLNCFPYPLEQDHFDYVISIQVLEHLFYPTRFLMEIKRILRMGGCCIVYRKPCQLGQRICFNARLYTVFGKLRSPVRKAWKSVISTR